MTAPSPYKIQIHSPALHAAQQTVRDAARRFNVVCCGRRWGKNVLVHDVLIESMLNGRKNDWGSPTYKNLADDWRLLLDIFSPLIKDKSEQEHRIQLITGGILEMWSLDNPEVIRGRASNLWIVNEAAMISDLYNIWSEIIRPTLIDSHGGAWFPSTPKGFNGFRQLYQLGSDQLASPEWAAWHYSSYSNPYLDPAELDAMRQTMTEEQYRQEILAEFIEGAGQVIRNIAACMLAPKINSPDEHRGHAICAGVDWGKQNDFTVIAIGCKDCMRELFLDRFNEIDYAFQRQRLMVALNKWNVHRAIVETNSIGAPILEQLQRDGIRVTGFETTHPSKIALIESMALMFEKGEFQFIPDETAKMELEAYERQVTRTGVTTYNAPEGLHDDTVIARALMLKAIREAPTSLAAIQAMRSRPLPMQVLAKTGVF